MTMNLGSEQKDYRAMHWQEKSGWGNYVDKILVMLRGQGKT